MESVGDLLWYAELADALARLNGHPAADVTHRGGWPDADLDPPAPDEPLVPRLDSVAVAAAGVAQLVALGGRTPSKCRTWAELVTGLLRDAAIGAARTGTFAVPPAVAAADGTDLPGTDLRVEIAGTARQLAGWSDYMGNCIAGSNYQDLATAGRAVFVALRRPDGRMLANAEIHPSARGWRVNEVKARFNEDVDAYVRERLNAWVRGLPVPQTPPVTMDRERPPRPVRPLPSVRAVRDLGEPLGDRVTAELARPDSAAAGAVLAVVAARLRVRPGGSFPRDAVTALRRADPVALRAAVRAVLADPAGPDLGALWRATGDRPLARALAALDPSTVDRTAPLLVDAPLLGSLRALARLPRIAPARSAHLVGLRLRTAIGWLLRADAPELAGAVAGAPYGPAIRAAALAVTTWGGLAIGALTAVGAPRRITLPGFPESSLRDEVSESAWPNATALGADRDAFWDRIAAHGLLLPSAWRPAGGWPALWARAYR